MHIFHTAACNLSHLIMELPACTFSDKKTKPKKNCALTNRKQLADILKHYFCFCLTVSFKSINLVHTLALLNYIFMILTRIFFSFRAQPNPPRAWSLDADPLGKRWLCLHQKSVQSVSHVLLYAAIVNISRDCHSIPKSSTSWHWTLLDSVSHSLFQFMSTMNKHSLKHLHNL